MDLGYLGIWKSHLFWKSCVPNLKFLCFVYEPSFFVFGFLFQNMIIWWNHEKSKTRNLLTFILPADFLQKFEYEFHSDKNTWNEHVVKRTNFSIFGQCNPYHQSTYRFPPLHPISAPDAQEWYTSGRHVPLVSPKCARVPWRWSGARVGVGMLMGMGITLAL